MLTTGKWVLTPLLAQRNRFRENFVVDSHCRDFLLTVIVEKTFSTVIVEKSLLTVIVEKLFVDGHRARLVLIGPVPADVFIVAGGMAGDGRQLAEERMGNNKKLEDETWENFTQKKKMSCCRASTSHCACCRVSRK